MSTDLYIVPLFTVELLRFWKTVATGGIVYWAWEVSFANHKRL